MGPWQEWTWTDRSSARMRARGAPSSPRFRRWRMSVWRQWSRLSSPGSSNSPTSCGSQSRSSARKSRPCLPQAASRLLPVSRYSSRGSRSLTRRAISRSDRISAQNCRQGLSRKRWTSRCSASRAKTSSCAGGSVGMPKRLSREGSPRGADGPPSSAARKRSCTRTRWVPPTDRTSSRQRGACQDSPPPRSQSRIQSGR